MIEKEEKKLLNILIEASQPLTSDELSFQISMSSKTIRRRLKELDRKIQEYGACIQSKKGSGTSLQIFDHQLFQKFIQDNLLDASDYEGIEGKQLGELVSILLSQHSYMKADDVADLLFISKSKLTQLLNQLRGILDYYELSIVSKPYYGMKIEGSEFNFRRFISSYYAQNYGNHKDEQSLQQMQIHSHSDNEIFEKISDIIKDEVAFHDYPMPLNVISNLETHLYILIMRLSKGMNIDPITSFMHSLDHSKEEELANSLIKRIEEAFTISIPESEYEYILIHLISKKVMDISESNNIPDKINILVEQILNRICETTNIDLLSDFDLRIMLGLHLVPLMSRIQFHIEMKNPILEEVRARCVAGYDLAIICAQLIQEKFSTVLSEHEISYFALHFDVALNRNNASIRKKNILVVCSSGRASAQLLKIKFTNLFSQYLNVVTVCDVSDVGISLKKEEYDYIFTTIPLKIDTHIPVFEFHFFLNTSSIEMIRSVLHGDIQNAQIIKYFRPDMFLGIRNFQNKEEVLTYMMKQIRFVETLPDEFESLVWERESVYGTDIMPTVALPHPNQVITLDTFIAVMILKKPIVWSRNKVQMVFLISISREDSEKYKFLFEWIINLLSNSQAVKRIVESGSYTALRDELLQIEMKEI